MVFSNFRRVIFYKLDDDTKGRVSKITCPFFVSKCMFLSVKEVKELTNLEKATKNLKPDELAYFNKRFKKEGKSEKVAYIWWAFLGFIGGHRFYLRHYRTGLVLLAITIFTCGIGAVAGLYDIVNIKRITEKENKETILHIIKEAKRK